MSRLIWKLDGTKEAYIVWFHDVPINLTLGTDYSVPDVSVPNLSTIPGTETIVELSDSIIFCVTACCAG